LGIDFGNTGWGGRPFWTFIKCPKRLMGLENKTPNRATNPWLLDAWRRISIFHFFFHVGAYFSQIQKKSI